MSDERRRLEAGLPLPGQPPSIPTQLAWLSETPPEVVVLLLDLLLAAERGEMTLAEAQDVVLNWSRLRGVVGEETHGNILCTLQSGIRQQNISNLSTDNPYRDRPLACSMSGLSGPMMLWFGRLPVRIQLHQMRVMLQSGVELPPRLVSSLRESLIAATMPVNNR